MNKLEFKQKCIELRRQNYTLGEMVKLLNRPKTTIYFHVQNIPISLILKNKISQISRDKISKLRALGLTTQKGKSWLNRHCREFEKWSPATVNLVGHVVFDGGARNGSTMYHNRNLALIDNFRKKVKQIYDYEPRIREKGGDVITLAYHNIELTNFLITKKRELISKVSEFPREYQREFLKAFFDDEGCMTFRNKKRIIRGFQHNEQILVLIQKLLKGFNIESKVDTRFNEIVISRRPNLEKFARQIGFMKGLCVNGKRTNSIWKKDLEKRKILEMAINSYQT